MSNQRVPNMNDWLRLKDLAIEVWNHETLNECSRDEAIDAVCFKRYWLTKRSRDRIHSAICTIESHCYMKVAGLL